MSMCMQFFKYISEMTCTIIGKSSRVTVNGNVQMDSLHDISTCNSEPKGEFLVIHPWLPVVTSSVERLVQKSLLAFKLKLKNVLVVKVESQISMTLH